MNVSIAAFLRENASRYPDKENLIKDCIQATGRPRRNITNAWLDICHSNTPVRLGVQPHPITFTDALNPTINTKLFIPQGLNESQLRAKHDIKFIIRNAVKSLKRGTFLSDAEFIKLCNISSLQNYRIGLNDEEFNIYHGKAGGVIYWSHSESIEQMKQESILR